MPTVLYIDHALALVRSDGARVSTYRNLDTHDIQQRGWGRAEVVLRPDSVGYARCEAGFVQLRDGTVYGVVVQACQRDHGEGWAVGTNILCYLGASLPTLAQHQRLTTRSYLPTTQLATVLHPGYWVEVWQNDSPLPMTREVRGECAARQWWLWWWWRD
jgi:hypothetical protein